MRKFSTAVTAALLGLTACAPSPENVCEHVFDLMKKELGDAVATSDDDAKKFHEECVKQANADKDKKGTLEYKKMANCVMDATSLETLAKCDAKDEQKAE